MKEKSYTRLRSVQFSFVWSRWVQWLHQMWQTENGCLQGGEICSRCQRRIAYNLWKKVGRKEYWGTQQDSRLNCENSDHLNRQGKWGIIDLWKNEIIRTSTTTWSCEIIAQLWKVQVSDEREAYTEAPNDMDKFQWICVVGYEVEVDGVRCERKMKCI